mgnify:CR=1 FL=1
MKHVVIAGGGFAGVRLARKLRKEKNVQITLINESEDFRYSPALYRAATGFKVGTARIPLEWMLIDSDNVNVVCDKVAMIDPDHRKFTLTSGSEISYDYAVCALGMVTTYFNIDGIADHAFGVKSVQEILTLKQHIHDSLEGKRDKKQNYVVIGAGPTGIEVAATLGMYVQNVMKKHKIRDSHVEIYLVEAGPRILPQMNEHAGLKAEKELKKRGVKILTNTKVTAETNLSLHTSNGNIATHNVIWTAGAMNNPFFADNAGHFTVAERGKIKVNKHLQSHTNVYVAGDNAATQFSGLAYIAVRHGNFIAKDIKNRIRGKKRKNYADPYPLQVVPVGRISLFQYRKFSIGGRLVNIVRRVADLVGYSDVLGPLKALTIWQNSEPLEDEWCNTCRLK